MRPCREGWKCYCRCMLNQKQDHLGTWKLTALEIRITTWDELLKAMRAVKVPGSGKERIDELMAA